MPFLTDRSAGLALEQFATVGFTGASLQQIADIAGYSKSSVLCHIASKEALLEAVLTPAIDRLEEILDRFVASSAAVLGTGAVLSPFLPVSPSHDRGRLVT